MKILIWNCRDAAKPSFTTFSKTLIRQHRSNIVFSVLWDLYGPSVGLFGGTVVAQQKDHFLRINNQVLFGVISISNTNFWILSIVNASTFGIEH